MSFPDLIELRPQRCKFAFVLQQMHGDGAESVRDVMRAGLLDELGKASKSSVAQLPLNDRAVNEVVEDGGFVSRPCLIGRALTAQHDLSSSFLRSAVSLAIVVIRIWAY
jgi:hypothetical protein